MHTYQSAWDPKCVELLLVVGSGLGAIVRDKDNLFACGPAVKTWSGMYAMRGMPTFAS
jgi:hypothetical protein